MTKTDPGLTKDRTHQSDAAGAVSKSSGRTSTGKALPVGVAQPSDGVRSVAELAVVIRRDPDNRKKRLKRAEALRECGLDEATVAESLHALGAKLSQNTQVGAVGLANAKLFLHVLKESMHVLEPQKAAANSDSTDTPPFVRFIHNVPRPVRTCTGRRLNPRMADVGLCRARRAGIPSGQVMGRRRDSRHGDRREPVRCRRLGMRRVRRRMCLPITGICPAFCVMSSRNHVGVIDEPELRTPQWNLCHRRWV